jgi:hypothetical protein
MVTVAGSATHLTQPSHKLYQPSDQPSDQPSSTATNAPHTSGFWKGIFADAGVSIDPQGSNQHAVRPLKRGLDREERRGVYMLLTLLGGSWLLSGLLERSEKHGGRVEH